MLASLADAPLTDPKLIYEPKYDGIRAIVEIEGGSVRLWSRLGNEKTAQFPEIVQAFQVWARRRRTPVVLDGEIVALDSKGNPTGFQHLQGRIHLTGGDSRSRSGRSPSLDGGAPTAFIAFDLLREGGQDLRDRPLTERRASLERVFGNARSNLLRLSESVRGDGRALYERALSSGWEGLIAKRADSLYKSGKRTPDWRKLKIVREQEFVIGGWTEPRQTRSYFGALLLGVYENRDGGRPMLVYVGHVGTGFDERELARLMRLLTPLETKNSPFAIPPKSNERPHWVTPKLVAQVKFTEWTDDGKLRHPVYLGLRDDKKPDDVHREGDGRLHAASTVRLKAESSEVRLKPDTTYKSQVVSGFSRTDAVIEQLSEVERSRRDGVVVLPDGDELSVSNLHKVFWPKEKLTKGDLLRYYAEVAPLILPAVEDRPLTMKRLPNGIEGKDFYQHRAPDDVPPNVRVQHVPGEKSVLSRLIGGNLKTLLYMTQLAAISQDPWFSRITSPDAADHVAFDLDPAEGVPFRTVLDVARWIRDELAALGAIGVPKTSGADGLHVYIPLPPETPYDAGLLFCQIVATVVVQKHGRVATIERQVRSRGSRVYIDCLQNLQGKTLATAYSARASRWAGVSTPLTWDEVDRGVVREDFTIKSAPSRFRQVGDLWKTLRTAKGVDFARVARYSTQTSSR
jgi:bifunctional non-homologous end joining protein LigD